MSPPANAPNSGSASAPQRVLCVEDDEQIGVTFEVALRLAGYSAERSKDGIEALERIRSGGAPFDLVLTDHNMPRLTGLGLVEKLRGMGFAGKIIVVSGHLEEDEETRYRGHAVDAILSKPLSLPLLFEAVNRVLS